MKNQQKVIIQLTEEEWIKVIELVEQKCSPGYDTDKWNEFNGIKIKMLFQFRMKK